MNTTGSTTRSGNKAMSLVSGMLSWLMSCTGGTGSDPAEQLEDGYDLRYLVEQRHRAFWELVQRILELNDVVLMIRMLLDFLQDDLGAPVAAVFLVDQNSQSMSRIMRGTPTESGLVPSRGLVGEALRSRVARFLVNFNLDEGYDAEVDLAQEFQGQKLFCVPLIEHDAVYAIIQATTAKPTRRVMDELHVKLLTWLGPILSSCMRKCIEFHDVLLSERTQKALLHIISSSDTEDTVLNLVDGVIDGACHITKAGRVSLFMVDWETEELWSLSSSDYDETLRVPLRASIAPPGSRFASWDFNVFTADLVTLPKLLEEMYLDFKVDEVLHTTKHRLQNFIVAMKEHYHPNPFHNFLHAFSVVHASYLLLSTTDAAQMLQPLDIAACLVASLGHDVDHPGHTNDFEVVSGSQLAMLYSDESVLEHHHAYTTFRLISKEKNANILQNLTRADYRHVRKMVIIAILGTDMANHFKFLESLEKVLRPASHHVDTSTISTAKRDSSSVTAIVATEGPVVDTPRGSTSGSAPNSFHSTTGPKFLPGRSSSGRLTKNGWVYNGTVEDRLFLVKTLVHASDLSGQVFPKAVALKWSNMISKEFAYQALMEQAENIPISYRNIDDPLKMVEGQLFFAQKIVSPLWDLMHIMLPGLEHCMENLTANVAHYEQELQRLKDARFEEGLSADAMRQEREQQLEREEEDLIEQQQNRRARRDSMCGCEDEGVAVPGLARHNPAKFNSFRTIPEDDSNSDDVEAGDGDSPSVRSSVLAAAEQSRQLPRSRSNSSSSSSSEEIDEQSLVVYE
ncbi:hypothetical protein BBJ29_006570 [Phytophthora kernoviae]|uniref:Phosphodiesterase n=1 Tax=Phytophthora kernoviae TaxID=325452 RepID=A0A3F2S3Q0_9STRA|nr:hypothetical protein BBJ29_006570 [Phytophthora kernoviae]RLN69717.1 hypothetical protein BBP00_00000134 [Phytophthora kernoviae]